MAQKLYGTPGTMLRAAWLHQMTQMIGLST